MAMANERSKQQAIVSRMRELLRRAAAAQSAHSRLRRSTVATAKKWKRAVGRIQKRGGGADHHDPRRAALPLEEDAGTLSSSSSISSSKGSFSWDTAERCCSASSALSPAANCSPLLWPAFVSAQANKTTAYQHHHQQQQHQASSSPATTLLRLSCGSSWSAEEEDEDDEMRMAHWVTTDSDFVVLEL